MRLWAHVAVCLAALCTAAFGLGQPRYVESSPRPGSVAIARGGRASALYVDASDYAGVVRATSDLQSDIELVTGVTPAITQSEASLRSQAIIIGTIGKSPVID